jgi:hypothetical protein
MRRATRRAKPAPRWERSCRARKTCRPIWIAARVYERALLRIGAPVSLRSLFTRATPGAPLHATTDTGSAKAPDVPSRFSG